MTLLELMGVKSSKTSQPYETFRYDTYDSHEMGWKFHTDSGKFYIVRVILPLNDAGSKPISPKLLGAIFSLVTKTNDYGDIISSSEDIISTGSMTETARIFSTVLSVCRTVDKKQKPLVWMFTAKEPSRKKLYQKLAISLASQIGAQVKIMQDDKAIECYLLIKPGKEAQKIVSEVVKEYKLI
jgi:hypothetical protein